VKKDNNFPEKENRQEEENTLKMPKKVASMRNLDTPIVWDFENSLIRSFKDIFICQEGFTMTFYESIKTLV
jgi:hypothetical protein